MSPHFDAIDRPVDIVSVYDEHADFVWTSLQRLGVHNNDLEDMVQEVFVVVHRRLSTFNGSCRMTTWLYGICIRVAAWHRRRAWFRRETPSDAVDGLRGADLAALPDEAVAARQECARLKRVLDAMAPEKRAVFIMFEIDDLPCEEIAAILDVPRGTVHSRLRKAREQFEGIVRRLDARDRTWRPA